jgi:adenylate cyclase
MPLAASAKRWLRPHPALLAGAFIIIFTGVVAIGQRASGVLSIAENFAADWMASIFEPPAPQHPDIVILSITEKTLAQFPFRSPVDREYLAKLLDALAERKVRAVAFDILFDQPTLPQADAAFLDAAKRFPAPLVVGWTDRDTKLTESQYKFQREYLQGIRAGFVNLASDRDDGTVRYAFPGRLDEGQWRTSFAGTIAEALGKTAPREGFPINYRLGPDRGTPPFRTFPIEILKAKVPADWFDNKIVIVGADLPFDDRHRTPFAALLGNTQGTVPGTQIQAQILAQLLDGVPPKVKNRAIQLGIVFGLACLALLIARWESGVGLQIAAGAVVIVALWGLSALLYGSGGIVLPVVVPTVGFGIGLFGAVAYVGHLRRLEGQFVRQVFGKYVAPGVLKKLEANPGSLQLGGEKREMSFVFTDIEGFTTFAEKQEPNVLVNVINRYLDALTDEVLRCGGYLDKFIGDAVMAVFGAPEMQRDHAKLAIDCAMAMRAAAERVANELKAEGYVFGRTRIGVHSGSAIVGNIGGERKFNYTAVGDVVNTASRLEGANKNFGTDICLSGETCRLAGFTQVRPIGRLVVKGRTEGLPVMTPVTDNELLQTESYNAAYELMAAGNGAAVEAFAMHVKKWPQDRLALFHFDRLKTGKIDDRIVLEGK